MGWADPIGCGYTGAGGNRYSALAVYNWGGIFRGEAVKNLRWIILGGGVQFFDCRDRILGAFGWDYPAPIHLYWLPFAVSSTAIVLHIYRDKYQLDTPAGRSGLAILIFQDIIIIPVMLAVPYLVIVLMPI